MPLADPLPAIRALPADDRRELVRLLSDERDGPAPPDGDVPDLVRELLSYGGVFSAGSQVTTDADGWRVLIEAMSELKGNG